MIFSSILTWYVMTWLIGPNYPTTIVCGLIIISSINAISQDRKQDNDKLSQVSKNKSSYTNSARNLSSAVKRKVWQRDHGRCVSCGSNEWLEYDHIIPVSKGGSNTVRNIQLLCSKCNQSKSNKIM